MDEIVAWTAIIMMFISGILFLIGGYTPQIYNVSEYEQLIQSKEIQIINHLPYSDKFNSTISENPAIKEIVHYVSTILSLDSIVSKLGGIAVMIGTVIAFMSAFNFTTSTVVKIISFIGTHTGKHLVTAGSGVGLLGFIIPIALYLWNRQFGELEHHFLVLLSSISGVGIILAFVGQYMFHIYLNSTRNERRMYSLNPVYSNTNSPISHYCMSCGTKHDQYACPRCGSKMKRIGP